MMQLYRKIIAEQMSVCLADQEEINVKSQKLAF